MATVTVKSLSLVVEELKLVMSQLIDKVNQQDQEIAWLKDKVAAVDEDTSDELRDLGEHVNFLQDRVQSIDEGLVESSVESNAFTSFVTDVVETAPLPVMSHEQQLEVVLEARKVGVEYVESQRPVVKQHVVQVDSSAWGAWMSRSQAERADIIKKLGLIAKPINRSNVYEIEALWSEHEVVNEDNNAIDKYCAELDAQVYDRGEMPNGMMPVLEQVLVLAGGDNEPF